MNEVKMDDIISLAKRRGFVYQGSEIYGGMAGIYDYGPLGVELLNNLKAAWWKTHVYDRDDFYGLDAAIFKEPKVWEASGHTSGFSDPLAECKKCNTRIRVDKELEKVGVTADEKMSEAELSELFDSKRDMIKCPKCGAKDFGPVRAFNLLVKTNMGDFTGNGFNNPVYLPGEACQGIYLNFKNVVDTTPAKIPFGIAQIGKAFRNEISPRNFLFRTRELDQADTQYFVPPHQNKDRYEEIKQARFDWYVSMGIKPGNLRFKQHENLVFYASDAWDIEYNYPSYGFDEMEGIHDRTDYDLTQHSKFSGTDLSYTDPSSNEKYVPWILETSVGMGRMFLAFLSDAYDHDDRGGSTRTVLRFPYELAPYKVCVSPLLKNKPELVGKAREVYAMLKKDLGKVIWDDNGNIGKRYRRQDEIGTPYCVVVDFETLGNEDDGANKDTVTVRNRDTTEQTRVSINDLASVLHA